jgi:hypothetical protein
METKDEETLKIYTDYENRLQLKPWRLLILNECRDLSDNAITVYRILDRVSRMISFDMTIQRVLYLHDQLSIIANPT